MADGTVGVVEGVALEKNMRPSFEGLVRARRRFCTVWRTGVVASGFGFVVAGLLNFVVCGWDFSSSFCAYRR